MPFWLKALDARSPPHDMHWRPMTADKKSDPTLSKLATFHGDMLELLAEAAHEPVTTFNDGMVKLKLKNKDVIPNKLKGKLWPAT